MEGQYHGTVKQSNLERDQGDAQKVKMFAEKVVVENARTLGRYGGHVARVSQHITSHTIQAVPF